MEILIGLALAAFVLWLWLSGHWFGRVLVFLPLFGLGVLMLAPGHPVPGGEFTVYLVEYAAAGGVAWLIASLPAGLGRLRADYHRTRDTERARQLLQPHLYPTRR